MRERRAPFPLWLSLATGEIRNNRVFAMAFALSLSLGLSGFLLLDAFKRTLSEHLDERSRAMLGADLGVFADRPLADDEASTLQKLLPQGTELRHEMTMLSMVARGDLSRLVEIKAIDDAYPFYGQIGLHERGERGRGVATDLTGAPHVWVYPEVLAQLGAKLGDEVRIGQASFTITDVVERDPSVASAGIGIAPLVFIGIPRVAATQLVGKGARVFYGTLAALPPKNVDAESVATAVRKELAGDGVRVKAHREASEDLYRALLHLSDFLGLVALVALFFAGVGGAYLFRSFLERRLKDVAILLSLGMPLAEARLVYVAQLVILGLASTVLTTAFAAALLPLVPRALGALMPQDVTPHLAPFSVLLVLGMGVGGSILACLPLLGRLGSVQPAALFQEGSSPRLELKARHALWWLPALATFYLLAIVTSHSVRTGSLFTGIFLGAAVVCALVALLGMKIAGALARGSQPLPVSLALLSLSRHRLATLASFVALGLGALLVNLVPQIRHVLASELERPGGEETPSLFLFDIQDEQVAPLGAAVSGLGARLAYVSPLVRARLTAINDAPVKTAARDGDDDRAATREGAEEKRALNRGYNLSYRATFAPSETLASGRPFQGAYDPAKGGPAEISVEERFAERLGLSLGDKMRFDVQGVPVDGVVVNTRHVRWTSFQPNFFVQFQPGLLDDAPKTFVAAIPALGRDAKLAMQAAVVRQFPNVSMVDVAATVERILGIVQQMARTLILMAGLSLVAGLAVLFSIARYQALRRLPDVTLLKALGTSFARLRTMAALEFGLLGLTAAGLGAALSIGAAYILAQLLFDHAWAFDWQTPLVTAVALAALTTVVGLAAVDRSLRTPAVEVLNQGRDV